MRHRLPPAAILPCPAGGALTRGTPTAGRACLPHLLRMVRGTLAVKPSPLRSPIASGACMHACMHVCGSLRCTSLHRRDSWSSACAVTQSKCAHSNYIYPMAITCVHVPWEYSAGGLAHDPWVAPPPLPTNRHVLAALYGVHQIRRWLQLLGARLLQARELSMRASFQCGSTGPSTGGRAEEEELHGRHAVAGRRAGWRRMPQRGLCAQQRLLGCHCGDDAGLMVMPNEAAGAVRPGCLSRLEAKRG